MKLKDIADVLEATLLIGEDQLDKEILTGGASDLMSDILAGLSENCVLLTGLITVQAIRTAFVAGVGAVVFVRGKTPPQEVIEQARSHDIPLLSTKFSMFVSSGRLYNKGITGLSSHQ